MNFEPGNQIGQEEKGIKPPDQSPEQPTNVEKQPPLSGMFNDLIQTFDASAQRFRDLEQHPIDDQEEASLSELSLEDIRRILDNAQTIMENPESLIPVQDISLAGREARRRLEKIWEERGEVDGQMYSLQWQRTDTLQHRLRRAEAAPRITRLLNWRDINKLKKELAEIKDERLPLESRWKTLSEQLQEAQALSELSQQLTLEARINERLQTKQKVEKEIKRLYQEKLPRLVTETRQRSVENHLQPALRDLVREGALTPDQYREIDDALAVIFDDNSTREAAYYASSTISLSLSPEKRTPEKHGLKLKDTTTQSEASDEEVDHSESKKRVLALAEHFEVAGKNVPGVSASTTAATEALRLITTKLTQDYLDQIIKSSVLNPEDQGILQERGLTLQRFLPSDTMPYFSLDNSQLFQQTEASSFPLLFSWKVSKDLMVQDPQLGTTLAEIDQEIEAYVLKGATERKRNITSLAACDSPEAILTLLTLAAQPDEWGDSSTRAPIKHEEALTAYGYLKKRADLQQLIATATQTYPALSFMSDFVTEPHTIEELRTEMLPALQPLLSDQTANTELRQMAMDQVPHQELLVWLRNANRITAEQATSLEAAYQNIARWSKELPKVTKSGNQFDDEKQRTCLAQYEVFFREFCKQSLDRGRPGDHDLPPEAIQTQKIIMLAEYFSDPDFDPQAAFALLGESSQYLLHRLSEPAELQKLLQLTESQPEQFSDAYSYLTPYAGAGSSWVGRLEMTCQVLQQLPPEDNASRQSESHLQYGSAKQGFLEVLPELMNTAIDNEVVKQFVLKNPDLLMEKRITYLLRTYPRLIAAPLASELCHKFLNTPDAFNARMADAIQRNKISSQEALNIMDHAPSLMLQTNETVLTYCLDVPRILLRSPESIVFVHKVCGEFTTLSRNILQGYVECVERNPDFLEQNQFDTVLETIRAFRVISPELLDAYIAAKKQNTVDLLRSRVNHISEALISTKPLSDDERREPYFQSLVTVVYPNNAGSWTSYDSNNSCQDRSSDLAEYSIRPRYRIDLMSGASVRMRTTVNPKTKEVTPMVVDAKTVNALQAPLVELAQEAARLSYDPVAMRQSVETQLSALLGQSGQAEDGVPLTLEQQFLQVFLRQKKGEVSVPDAVIKKLLIAYDFSRHEDIREYVLGTQDRVGRAQNEAYVLLCELHAFYTDRLKETIRQIWEKSSEDVNFITEVEEVFLTAQKKKLETEQNQRLASLQINKLGLEPGFVARIQNELQQRTSRTYTTEETTALIRRYEQLSSGFSAEKTNPGIGTTPEQKKKQGKTQGIYGMLRAQRAKTMRAYEMATGQPADAISSSFADISFDQLPEGEAELDQDFDPELYAVFLAQELRNLFEREMTQIDRELEKFEAIEGKKRTILNGVITKTKESAHARMVGGVCVSGDNPSMSPVNMWDQPNYFQMVLQDSETNRCQGLILLHAITTENGKKVLTASLNPSSTYVFASDEASLFNGMAGALEQFAQENGFDAIATSQNKQIRTNRTGGIFESEMDKRVAAIGENINLNGAIFSYQPKYVMDKVDLIWRGPNWSNPAASDEASASEN